MPEPPPPADAIVVAAGASSRMAGIDKLSHVVAGKPLLAWSIDALAAAAAVERIVVVAPAERIVVIRDAPWLSPRVVAVVAGGERRHESVAAGLAALEGLDAANGTNAAGRDPARSAARIVLVHDGARPLASAALIAAVLDAAAEHGAAIPVLPVTDTIKRISGGRVEATLDRTTLGAAQTPQGARRSLLRDAFTRFPPNGPEAWTDEAALLEACRIPVHALPGEATNLKVTLPADLDTVEAALGGARPPGPSGLRTGTGFDSHPFGPGRPLALGGIEVPRGFRLHGHSDGDVALHAIADAMLGAAGLGDLGRLFPPDASTPRGIASHELIETVVDRVGAAGFRASSVDLTIIAARPRLAGVLDEMRDVIAGLLDLSPGSVNVKASTGNLSGMEGAGRGISAAAIATLERIL